MLALSRRVIEAAVQLPDDDRPLFCFAGNSLAGSVALASWQERTNGGAAMVADNVLSADGSSRGTTLRRCAGAVPLAAILGLTCHAKNRWMGRPLGQYFRVRSGLLPKLFDFGCGVISCRHFMGFIRARIVGCTYGLGRRWARKTQGCGSTAYIQENDRISWMNGRPSAWSAATGQRNGRALRRRRPPRDLNGPRLGQHTGGIRWALSLPWPVSAKPPRKRCCRCWRPTFSLRAEPVSPSLDATYHVGDNGQ